jgi:hypothetical protein
MCLPGTVLEQTLSAFSTLKKCASFIQSVSKPKSETASAESKRRPADQEET